MLRELIILKDECLLSGLSCCSNYLFGVKLGKLLFLISLTNVCYLVGNLYYWYFYFLSIKKKKYSKRFQPEPVSEWIEGEFFLVYLHWTLSCRTFIWDFGWWLVWDIILMGQIPEYLVLRHSEKFLVATWNTWWTFHRATVSDYFLNYQRTNILSFLFISF